MAEAKPIEVRTLLGARSFDSSVTCLASLVRHSVDPVRLVAHEDGTLTDEHRGRLAEVAPEIRFVDRKFADEAVTETLRRHPLCRESRDGNLLFLKVFDIPLLAGPPFSYTDSDILFLRRFRNLFAAEGDPRFMMDGSHAYALRPWRLRPFGPLRLRGRVNTGLILGWRHPLDLDFVEWTLSRLRGDSAFRRRNYWAEQTCWAALACRHPARLLSERQFVMASPRMEGYSRETVAIHFVSTYRNRLDEFAPRQRGAESDAVEPRSRPAAEVGPLGMGWSDLRRRIVLDRFGLRKPKGAAG